MFLHVVSLGIVLPEASASTMHVPYSEKDAGIKYLAYNHWYSDRDLCRNNISVQSGCLLLLLVPCTAFEEFVGDPLLVYSEGFRVLVSSYL